LAVVVSEHLFIKVTEQMKRLDANIRPIQSALEQAPEVFDALSVNAPLDVAFHVIDDVVSEVWRQPHVTGELVSHQFRSFRNGFANGRVRDNLVAISSYFGAYFSATFQHPVDNRFRPVILADFHFDPSRLVHVAGFTADESFINFDLSTGTADLCTEEIVLHSQPNPLQHEPGRFLANLQIAGDLVGTDAVFAVRQHPSRGEPFVQWDRAIFVNRPDLNGELTLGVMAATLPSTPLRVEFADFLGAATGTNDLAVWPSPYRYVINTVVWIREIYNRLLEARWLGFHVRFHDENIAKITGRVKVIITQVYTHSHVLDIVKSASERPSQSPDRRP